MLKFTFVYFSVYDVPLLTIIPVLQFSQQPGVFVVLRSVMPLSANLGGVLGVFPIRVRPVHRMNHIWKMTYWGSRFWNIPFVEGK